MATDTRPKAVGDAALAPAWMALLALPLLGLALLLAVPTLDMAWQPA